MPDSLPVAATFASGEGQSRAVVGLARDDGEQWLSCTTAPLADLALYEAKRRGRNRVVNAPVLAGLLD